MEEKKPHAASLARSSLSSLSSLPLRSDRSFDSGSKFTLQTCWEAAELGREGLSALQGPRASAGSPVRNTEAGNKLDCAAAARRGLPEPRPGEGGGRSRFHREPPSHLFTNIEASLSRELSSAVKDLSRLPGSEPSTEKVLQFKRPDDDGVAGPSRSFR